jgi:Peptidase family M23
MAWWDGQVTQSCSGQYYCDGSVEGGKEGGVDILAAKGTPMTSISAGQVVGAGYHNPGNYVVTVRGFVPFFNQTMDLYYQHMQDTTVKTGDTVKAGDVVGHAGALANIEFGVNPANWPGNNGGWGGVWGPLPHPGRSINPVNSGFLDSIKKGGGMANTPENACLGCGAQGSKAWQACVDQYHRSKTYPACATPQQLSTDIGNALGISQLGGLAQHVNDLLSDPTRLIKGLIGVVLLLTGLVLLVKQLVPPGVQKAALAAVGV